MMAISELIQETQREWSRSIVRILWRNRSYSLPQKPAFKPITNMSETKGLFKPVV